MFSGIMRNCAIPMLLVIILSLMVLSREGVAQPYDDAVRKAHEKFNAGKLDEAVAEATQAIALDGNRYDAYFVVGLSYYKLEAYDLAKSNFQKALEHSSNDEEVKARIREALDLVETKKEFVTHTLAGAKAEKDGLFAKAAREYTEAFDLLPVREGIGLKAARLWKTRQEYAQSARILYNIASKSIDLDNIKEANDMLSSMDKDLTDIRYRNTEKGWYLLRSKRKNNLTSEEADKIIAIFKEAIYSKPAIFKQTYESRLECIEHLAAHIQLNHFSSETCDPYIGLAVVYALADRFEWAEKTLLTAANNGLSTLDFSYDKYNNSAAAPSNDTLIDVKYFLGLVFCDARASEFLKDVFGPATQESARDFCAKNI